MVKFYVFINLYDCNCYFSSYNDRKFWQFLKIHTSKHNDLGIVTYYELVQFPSLNEIFLFSEELND